MSTNYELCEVNQVNAIQFPDDCFAFSNILNEFILFRNLFSFFSYSFNFCVLIISLVQFNKTFLFIKFYLLD